MMGIKGEYQWLKIETRLVTSPNPITDLLITFALVGSLDLELAKN